MTLKFNILLVWIFILQCSCNDWSSKNALQILDKSFQDNLVRNNVKTILEKHCFPNQEGSCTVISQDVDRMGNICGYHMHRMGTRYEYKYDEQSRLQAEYAISGEEIDSTEYVYNERGDLLEIIGKGFRKTYQNFYDYRGRLVKQIEKDVNGEGEEVMTTVVKDWSSSDELLEESSYTNCEGDHTKTEFLIQSKKMEYNQSGQPTREIYMEDGKTVKDTRYSYRENGTLFETVEVDYSFAIRVTESGQQVENEPSWIRYTENGLVIEEYTYVSDPCMSLENYFLFKYFYDENGLRTLADVFEDGELSFQITYQYEYR